MTKKFLDRTIAACCAGVLVSPVALLGQAALKGDWSLTGGDIGQSRWQKAETKLSVETVPKGFKYLWKIKLGQAKGGESFSEPLLAPKLINAQGFKDFVYWSSNDTVYGVDSELGTLLWKKRYDVKPAPTGCSASNLSILMEPPVVINFNARRAPGAPLPSPPRLLAPSERKLGGGTGGGGFGFKGIYVLTPDGMLHEQIITTGADYAAPVKFLPAANSDAFGLNISGKTMYAETGRGCGGVANGLWAMDMTAADYAVVSYNSAKIKLISLTGPAIAPDGTAYVVTGNGTSSAADGVYANSVVAIGKDMKVRDWYAAPTGAADVDYVSPITFAYKGKQLVVAPEKNGSVVLLDAAALGGSDHHTPLAETASFSRAGVKHGWDGFAAWQDKDGTAWVFASISTGIAAKESSAKTNGPTPHGGIVAFRVQGAEDADGKFVLIPAWISSDMTNPAPPVIANGVLIALSGGNAATHAVLHVLDASTGKELYSSKDEIPTYTHLSGVAVGDSHVFFTDHDDVLYSFGIGIEH